MGLSNAQHDVLTNMRNSGMHRVASELQSLYEEMHKAGVHVTEEVAGRIQVLVDSYYNIDSPCKTMATCGTCDRVVEPHRIRGSQCTACVVDPEPTFAADPPCGWKVPCTCWNALHFILQVDMPGIGSKGDKITTARMCDPEPKAPASAHTPSRAQVKLRLHVMVPWAFFEAMTEVAQAGIKDGRTANDWKDYTAEQLDEKRGALLRHYGKREWAAVAFNAAILWWHDNRSKV